MRLIHAVVVLSLLGGCVRTGAGEPATAPPPSATPAGRVVAVGNQPEGIVADPLTHLVGVGVRDPDTLVLLDGRTGAVTARTPLPGHLRHLQLAAPGGPVLVPAKPPASGDGGGWYARSRIGAVRPG
jgi:hypothetical protein